MTQDSPYNKNQCLGFLMKKAFQCIVGQADKALEQHDLTYAQWMVIDQLSNSGPMGLLNLAKALELDPGALTRTIERLEIKGMVARVRTPQDKRSCQIELSEKSKELIDFIPNILADVMNQHLQGFDHAEYEKLIHALNQVIHNASALKAPPSTQAQASSSASEQLTS
jgi:DNA-binding MarR family transcriptional regulator